MFTLKNNVNDPYQVLLSAFKLCQACFYKVVPLAFLGAFFSFLPSILSSGNQILQFVFLSTCFLLSFLFLAGMIFKLYCVAYQIPHQFLDILKQAALKLLPLILLSLLYAIIVLSGTMLLIVPGVILAVSLMLCFILLITDNQSLLQSLVSSHSLIWGQWWMTLFVISIPLLLNCLVSLAGLVGLLTIFVSWNFPLDKFNLVATGLCLIIQSLLLPFVFSTALILIYYLKQKPRSSYVE